MWSSRKYFRGVMWRRGARVCESCAECQSRIARMAVAARVQHCQIRNIVHTTRLRGATRWARATDTDKRLAAGRASMAPRNHWAPRLATNLEGPSPRNGGRGAPPHRLRPTHPPARPRLHLVLRREDVPPRKAVEGDRRRQQPQQRAGPAKRLRQVLHLSCEHHGFCSPPLGPQAACLTLSPSAVARVLHLCAGRGRYRAVYSEHHVHTTGYEYEYNDGSSHSRACLSARAIRNTRTCIRI